MHKHILTILIIGCLFSSCQPTTNYSPSINGTWVSIGSGWALEITDSTFYQFYDMTSISCLPKRKGEFNEIAKSLQLHQDTLNIRTGVITNQFVRSEVLPKWCYAQTGRNKNNDPVFNFEVFAETVREHYAFFKLNNIQWNDVYAEQKEKLLNNPTDIQLYKILDETLGILNDNHGFLEATDDIYEALEDEDVIISELAIDDQPEYGDFQVAQLVSQHHLEEDMTKDSWLIQWGKMAEGVGYIQVKAMWLYANLNIPQELIDNLGFVDAYVNTFHTLYESDYIEKEVQGVSKIMDRVMSDLQDMERIVIDVRFNGGGQDAVSFEILSRFTNERLHVASQKLRYGDQFTKVLPLFVNGTDNAFTKPVYVLTSPQTGSAAEAFSISTMAMDNVQRIGNATTGALSTALEKTLPNGWTFAISNEIYMDVNGNNYENIGVPVDYKLNYPKDRQAFFRGVVNDLELDKTSILNAVNSLKED